MLPVLLHPTLAVLGAAGGGQLLLALSCPPAAHRKSRVRCVVYVRAPLSPGRLVRPRGDESRARGSVPGLAAGRHGGRAEAEQGPVRAELAGRGETDAGMPSHLHCV